MNLDIVVIGDTVLDEWLAGSSHRLCREAPVPVVEVTESETAPGAAANTATNAAALGARVRYFSIVGGGFDFWSDVPAEHAGEDVVAQLRVMELAGGAGILPSGAVHLELPTTVPNREVECYDVVLADDAAPNSPQPQCERSHRIIPTIGG